MPRGTGREERTFANPGAGTSPSDGYWEGDLADLDCLVQDLARGEDAGGEVWTVEEVAWTGVQFEQSSEGVV
jgi:hypothetical protein